MKRLVVIGLAYLLSACQSSLASLPQGHPAKVANFPAMASDLSDCVYRAAQSIPAPYVFHRHARAATWNTWSPPQRAPIRRCSQSCPNFNCAS